MNHTKIEWVKNLDGSQGYTINPVKGACPVGCSYCCARRLYERFHWDPTIRWWPPAFDLLDSLKRPSRIFVGSTMELFHPSLPDNWMEYNQRTAMKYPQHTFIFLTKMPQNLPEEWPDNCWVGVTATDVPMIIEACKYMQVVKATIKFLSLEPLLHYDGNRDLLFRLFRQAGINWLIIGQQTPASKKTEPKIEWIWEIVEAADKAGIPVFLKDNLKPLIFKDAISGQAALDTGLLNWVANYARSSQMKWPFRKKRKRHSFLTDRQKQVLCFMSKGLSNKEIGYEIGISEQTVKNHVSVILGKLGVFNRTEAVVEAIKKGIAKL